VGRGCCGQGVLWAGGVVGRGCCGQGVLWAGGVWMSAGCGRGTAVDGQPRMDVQCCLAVPLTQCMKLLWAAGRAFVLRCAQRLLPACWQQHLLLAAWVIALI
jgi:hypothetical protein